MSVLPLLDVAGVSKSFRGLRAVTDASLQVAQGEIVALIGPNGAGKTTLFNLIAGALAPDRGSIRFDGREITGLRADQACAAGIGRTFQIVKPFADMSVLDNVMVGGFRGNASAAVARERAPNALAALHNDELRHRPASSLTLPDRKKLEVARALATQPRLLLLDEVMAGLRPTETDVMVRAFQRLNEERTGPLQPALFALNMLVGTPAGDTYTEPEIRGWMQDAGLGAIERRDTPFGASLLVGRRLCHRPPS
jgi:branched-chain amino acid transport system ATP-binding protein